MLLEQERKAVCCPSGPRVSSIESPGTAITVVIRIVKVKFIVYFKSHELFPSEQKILTQFSQRQGRFMKSDATGRYLPREFLSQIAPFISRKGPRNLLEISRNLSIPYQTLRYRMQQLKRQGITVSPIVDTSRIGLRRVRASFKLHSDVQEKHLRSFFGSLYQAAGLHYYARSHFSNVFDSEFMVSERNIAELSRILQALEEMNLISNLSMSELVWKEMLMMKTQYYDYERGQWDVDYSSLKIDPSLSNPPALTQRQVPSNNQRDFDHVDLLIIKSLQINPWAKVLDISKQIGVSQAETMYHFHKHVHERRQISGYEFMWIGSKDAWAKHAIIGLTLIFREQQTDANLRNAIAIATALPFAWNHMLTERGAYMAELLIPIYDYPEVMKYLSEKIRTLDLCTPELVFPDWSCCSNYTIPYSIHSAERGWSIEAEKSVSNILQTISIY